ncbi:methylenetetrahydrofolate reductase C-terminal domain-containing protein [Chloroflexota bacterium]
MIVGERKPLDEIIGMLTGNKKILILGCGTCVSVCMAGGKKEVTILGSQLRMDSGIKDKNVEIDEETVQRQCDREYIEPIVEMAKHHDIVVSMACGAGVQMLSDMLVPTPVIPAVNTSFIGVCEDEGTWLERCRGCGNCLLAETGGVCPVARCAKALFNGPCGGSVNGICEVSPNTPCAWQLVYDRLKLLDRLDTLEEIQPIRDWSPSSSGIPRGVYREDMAAVSVESESSSE